MPKFRTPYNVDEFNVAGVDFELPSMTQQHFEEQCNINSIMDKYRITGTVPQVQGAQFGDFTNVGDYLQAQNTIIQAQEQFDALPATIRKRFDNNPALMLEFIQNPDNREEGIKLGIFNPVSSIVDNNSVVTPVVDVVKKTVE